MADDLVLLELQDRVATIRLNRPEKNNAVTFAMLDQLEQVIENVARMDDLAAIVVTGAGNRSFCGGTDERIATGREEGGGLFMRRFAHACARLANLEPPVIAAINGNCFAVGVTLAFSSDLRVAVSGAKFAIPAAGRGAPIATYVLPFFVGDCWAKEIILLGRPIDSDSLYRLGAFNRLVAQEDLWPTVEEFLARFRDYSLTGMRTAKALLNRATTVGQAAAMEAELAITGRLIEGPEFRSRVNAAVDGHHAGQGKAG